MSNNNISDTGTAPSTDDRNTTYITTTYTSSTTINTTVTSPPDKGLSAEVISAIVVGSVLGVVLIVVIILVICKCRTKRPRPAPCLPDLRHLDIPKPDDSNNTPSIESLQDSDSLQELPNIKDNLPTPKNNLPESAPAFSETILPDTITTTTAPPENKEGCYIDMNKHICKPPPVHKVSKGYLNVQKTLEDSRDNKITTLEKHGGFTSSEESLQLEYVNVDEPLKSRPPVVRNDIQSVATHSRANNDDTNSLANNDSVPSDETLQEDYLNIEDMRISVPTTQAPTPTGLSNTTVAKVAHKEESLDDSDVSMQENYINMETLDCSQKTLRTQLPVSSENNKISNTESSSGLQPTDAPKDYINIQKLNLSPPPKSTTLQASDNYNGALPNANNLSPIVSKTRPPKTLPKPEPGAFKQGVEYSHGSEANLPAKADDEGSDGEIYENALKRLPDVSKKLNKLKQNVAHSNSSPKFERKIPNKDT